VIQSVLRALALPALAFGLLVAESTLYRFTPWDPLTADLTLPLVLWMGLVDVPVSRGAPTAFAIGYLIDVFSSGASGLHALVLVGVYLVSRTASLRLFSAGVLFQMLLTLLASLSTSAGIILLRFIFEQSLDNPGALALSAAVRGVATAVVSPLVFEVARRVGPAGTRQEGSIA
jgi:rod shape-determining protein MreD